MSSAATPPIRVLIVDDHAVVRAGLRMLIEDRPEMTVAGEAGRRAEAVAAASQAQPDIILLDLDLAGDSGLALLPELLNFARKARVIILTGVLDPEAHHKAIALGAMGLVLKEQAAEVLVKAIQKVHAGEIWLDRTQTASVLTSMTRPGQARNDDPEGAKVATLTEREREIITLVAQGLKRKQIAEKLFISEPTVRNHLTSILDKLELSDRFELAFYAYRHGLAKPPA